MWTLGTHLLKENHGTSNRRCIEANKSCHARCGQCPRRTYVSRQTPKGGLNKACQHERCPRVITLTWTMPRGYAKHETPKEVHRARDYEGETHTMSSQGERHRKIKHSSVDNTHKLSRPLGQCSEFISKAWDSQGEMPNKNKAQTNVDYALKLRDARDSQGEYATRVLARRVRDAPLKHANVDDAHRL